MNVKRTVSVITAMTLAFGASACSKEEGTNTTVTSETTPTTVNTAEFDDEDKELINNVAEEKINRTLENKTIKWMANWDINPDNTGKSKSAALTMFEEKFGGTVEYYPTTFENRFSDLSTAILGGEGIDFFPIGSLDGYISGIVNGMFQPVDDYVDFNSELWSDVKIANDQLAVNGKHFSLITDVVAGEVVIYNRKTIEENGLDDPEELLANGEWTWDAYNKMLADFVDEDSGKSGIDGWWIEQPLYLTTGKGLISLDNGVLTSNIRSTEMERAMNYIYDIGRNSYLLDKSLYGWTTQEHFIGTGEELFYPCGLWCLWVANWDATFGEDAMFVPMPKDPDSDQYYLPAGLEGFMLCKDAQNPEGVAIYCECNRAVIQDEAVQDLNRSKIIEDYGWREDMVDMMNDINVMTRQHPVFELYSGVSTDINDMLSTAKQAASNGTEWRTTVDTYADTVETLIKEINAQLANQ